MLFDTGKLDLVPGKWQVTLHGGMGESDWESRRLDGWIPVSIDYFPWLLGQTPWVGPLLTEGGINSGPIQVIVWRHVGGQPKWKARTVEGQDSVLSLEKRMANDGYYPTMVAANSQRFGYYGESATDYSVNFTVVYRPDVPRAYLRFANGVAQFNNLNAAYRNATYTLRWVAMYGKDPDPRFAVIYDRRNVKRIDVYWNAYTLPSFEVLNRDALAHWRVATQPHLHAIVGGVRLAQIAIRDITPESASGDRYAATWMSDHIGPHGFAVVDVHDLETILLASAQAGYFPFRLSTAVWKVGPHNAAGVCAVILQHTDTPIARTLRVRRLEWFSDTKRGPTLGGGGTSPSPGPPDPAPRRRGGRVRSDIGDPRPPGADTASAGGEALASTPDPMQALDNYIIGYMKQRSIRAGSIAISLNKKLGYAAAYTWAEPDYPTTTPLSRFMVASVSKMVTSIGIAKLMSMGLLSRNDKLVDKGDIQSPSANWDQITIGHLLTHKARWNYTPAGDFEKDAAQALHGSLPVAQWPVLSKKEVTQYLAAVPGFAGSPSTPLYANLNYQMLGQVIEVLNRPKTYDKWTRDNVWFAVGIPVDTDPRRAAIVLLDPTGALPLGVAVPGMVPPEETAPGVRRTDWRFDRVEAPPFIRSPRHRDSYGGWTVAPVDLVRLLAAFDSTAYMEEKLMKDAERVAMWLPSGGSGFTLGGWTNAPPWVSHNGGTWGVTANLFRNQSLKLSFAYAFNRSNGFTPMSVWNFIPISDFPNDATLQGLVIAAMQAGALSGPDRFPLAGITEAIW